MRILVYTPLHPDYGIRQETLDSIMALEYNGVLDRHFSSGDNPYPTPYINVTYQHNKARDMVLRDHKYDALLSIEADMIVPPDTVTKLLEAKADIAYGLYVWRHDGRRWSAYKDLNLWGGHSISFNQNGHDVNEAWGNVIEVAGLGMGCTLIKRHVLHEIKFRLHDGSPSWIDKEYADDFARLGINPRRERTEMVCDDWLFALDAQHFGFSQKTHMGVVCGHISDDEGVLWPDPNEKELYKVESWPIQQ